MRFNPNTPLYLANATAFGVVETQQVLDTASASGKPLVVFVHGRGDEPNKSLRGATFSKGRAVDKIECGYGVTVVMFNWDSDFSGVRLLDRDRPIQGAKAASVVFGAFLSRVSRWASSRPQKQKPVLLVHSMGAIVVQHTVLSRLWPGDAPLFQTVLLSQPDADDVDHALWLEPLARRERVYVTVNANDRVLKRATDARSHGVQALGLGAREPLAASATYVDLTFTGPVGSEVDDDHEVFGKGAMNDQLYVCEFFEQALRGQEVRLDIARNVDTKPLANVFVMKDCYASGAECLRAPRLPDRS